MFRIHPPSYLVASELESQRSADKLSRIHTPHTYGCLPDVGWAIVWNTSGTNPWEIHIRLPMGDTINSPMVIITDWHDHVFYTDPGSLAAAATAAAAQTYSRATTCNFFPAAFSRSSNFHVASRSRPKMASDFRGPAGRFRIASSRTRVPFLAIFRIFVSSRVMFGRHMVFAFRTEEVNMTGVYMCSGSRFLVREQYGFGATLRFDLNLCPSNPGASDGR